MLGYLITKGEVLIIMSEYWVNTRISWANEIRWSPHFMLTFRCEKWGSESHFLLSLFIYFEREREREREQAGEEQTKRRQRIPSSLHAVSTELDMGLRAQSHKP